MTDAVTNRQAASRLLDFLREAPLPSADHAKPIEPSTVDRAELRKLLGEGNVAEAGPIERRALLDRAGETLNEAVSMLDRFIGNVDAGRFEKADLYRAQARVDASVKTIALLQSYVQMTRSAGSTALTDAIGRIQGVQERLTVRTLDDKVWDKLVAGAAGESLSPLQREFTKLWRSVSTLASKARALSDFEVTRGNFWPFSPSMSETAALPDAATREAIYPEWLQTRLGPKRLAAVQAIDEKLEAAALRASEAPSLRGMAEIMFEEVLPLRRDRRKIFTEVRAEIAPDNPPPAATPSSPDGKFTEAGRAFFVAEMSRWFAKQGGTLPPTEQAVSDQLDALEEASTAMDRHLVALTKLPQSSMGDWVRLHGRRPPKPPPFRLHPLEPLVAQPTSEQREALQASMMRWFDRDAEGRAARADEVQGLETNLETWSSPTGMEVGWNVPTASLVSSDAVTQKNVPNDEIRRAIKRAAGSDTTFERATWEVDLGDGQIQEVDYVGARRNGEIVDGWILQGYEPFDFSFDIPPTDTPAAYREAWAQYTEGWE